MTGDEHIVSIMRSLWAIEDRVTLFEIVRQRVAAISAPYIELPLTYELMGELQAKLQTGLADLESAIYELGPSPVPIRIDLSVVVLQALDHVEINLVI